jgi:molybdopterin-guanine dinucleotide biosynthesis protein A
VAGKPLLAHVLERLRPQASPVALSANGDPGRFAAFGLPVIADANEDYAGPLAGILAGLRWATKEAPDARFVVTAACDTPLFPENLVTAFLATAGDRYPAIVLARSAQQTHPVFGLWPVTLADDLEHSLASGMRKVLDWTDRHQTFFADFPAIRLGERFADPFFNANTPDELAEAQRFLEAERVQ